MQCPTPLLPARLHRGRLLSAAALTASALLLATAPRAFAQDGVWEHYEVADPKVITLEFDTDLLAYDLCWSDHTDMVKQQIVNGAIAQMNDPTRLHLIRMPGLPPFYRRTSNAPVWHDLTGEVIRSSDILPNRRDYHIDVEQALIEIAQSIRAERPGAKLAFEGFELQPLPGRPAAYEELGALQDFYLTDRTIYLNHVGHILHHALNSTFYRARVDFAGAQDNWLVFPNQTGEFSLASLDNPNWPPEEIEPEILALWGGGGDDPESDGPDGPVTPPGEVVILQPGSGWTGPTPEPDGYGMPSEPGWDAKAIARWDVVPHQTFDGVFEIGVVAFHMAGIDRVEFSVNDGPWEPVYEMTLNPRTEVEEYWVGLDASLFASDGPVEVRAIAYPNVGFPRVLGGELDWEHTYQGNQWTGEHSMFLYSNAHGTHDEIVVELPEGTYEWGSLPGVPNDVPDDRWLVLQPEPGAEVRIIPGRWNNPPKFRRIKGLYLDQPTDQGHLGGSSNSIIWFDEVVYTGPGTWEDSAIIRVKHQFWTDSVVTDAQWGQAEDFVRNCRFERIGEDTFGSTYLLANTIVNNPEVKPDALDWHPAVIANPLSHDNRIYVNLDIETTQKAWAFRNGTWDYWAHTDVAIVGCHTNKTYAGNQLLYLGGQTNHMIIKDNVWRGDLSWNYRLQDDLPEPLWRFTPHNVIMQNNDWYEDPYWLPNPTPLEGVTVIPIGSQQPIVN